MKISGKTRREMDEIQFDSLLIIILTTQITKVLKGILRYREYVVAILKFDREIDWKFNR